MAAVLDATLIDELIAAGLTLSQALRRIQPALSGQLEFRFAARGSAAEPRRARIALKQESAEAWFDIGFLHDREREQLRNQLEYTRQK